MALAAGIVVGLSQGKWGCFLEFLDKILYEFPEKLRDIFQDLRESLGDLRAALRRPKEDGSGPKGIVVSQEIAGGEPTHAIFIVATRYPAWLEGICLGTSTIITAAFLFDGEYWWLGFLGLAVLLSSVLFFMPDLMSCREIDINSRYLTISDSARYTGEKSETLEVREIRGVAIKRRFLGLGRRRLVIATSEGKVKVGVGLRKESLEWLQRYVMATLNPAQTPMQSSQRAPADPQARPRSPGEVQAAAEVRAALVQQAQQRKAAPELEPREGPKAPSMPPVAAEPRPVAPPPPSMPPRQSAAPEPLPSMPPPPPEPATPAATKRTPSAAQSAALSAFNKAKASTQNRAKEESAPAAAPAFGKAREAAEARAKAMRQSPVQRPGLDKSRI